MNSTSNSITERKRWVHFFFKKKLPLQTFTYYLGAPKVLNPGYRETKFDSMTKIIFNKGYELIDIKTQENRGRGVWIILVLRPKHPSLNITEEDFDKFETEEQLEYSAEIDFTNKEH